MIRKNARMIFLDAPMFETAIIFENSNWGGIITAPSATLTLDQINSFQDRELLGKHSDEDDSQEKNIVSTIQSIAPANLRYLLVQYDIPLKAIIERNGHAIA